MKSKSTEKLLKVLESKIDSLVEKRVSKIVPMLVEHEVNRLLKESEQTKPTTRVEKPKQKPTLDKNNITESLRAMVGGDMDEWRSMSYNTQTGIPGLQTPMTTSDGRPVDTSNPAVQSVMGAMMNPNLGDKFKAMDERSKQRNGRI